jgi:hypothetical protein
MVIKDKVAAAVYVDAVEDAASRFDTDAIELLVFTTGLLVDTLAIRKKIPSPSLRATAGEDSSLSTVVAEPPAIRPPAPQAAPAAPARPAPSPAPASAPPPAAPTPAPEPPLSRRTETGTVAIDTSQLRDQLTARPGFNIPDADEFGAAPTPAPARTQAPPPAGPKPAAPAAGDDKPSTQYIPPANLLRGGSAGPQTDDGKRHDEARRFARLLVSEIKLYNESKVDQGRRNNDLYERLKEDIDRSRQMYDERISDDVRKVSNYFYDELVRILADGRAEALGL